VAACGNPAAELSWREAMMLDLPKLPIGIQTFEKLREEGYLYVDKTKHLVDLIDNGSVYFLARPRRFGKSLTVSTFDSIFSGEKKLFRGLYAESFFDRRDYKTHPVIRLDMSGVSAREGMAEFKEGILDQLEWAASRYGAPFERTSPGRALAKLIKSLCDERSVVLLVDEYDKPMLDFLSESEKANDVREALRDFYIHIKSSDKFLRFVFITGVAKFSRMGVFSAFNNMQDISLKNEYASMLGYTHEELTDNFGPFIARSARELKISEADLLDNMAEYYDGFSFDGVQRVYNPFSALNFFSDSYFGDYWFETGAPSFLAKYMKDRKLTVEQFRGTEITRGFAASPGEIETATATSFLYQSGYLTLRPGTTSDFSLDYPNR
jgi:hypothetical protein